MKYAAHNRVAYFFINQQMFDHYSFDLWSTLIKSDPQFKIERAKYFHRHFNRDKKTVEEVEAVIRDIDKMCDYANQLVGTNIDGLEMISMVLYKLGYPGDHLSLRDTVSIYYQLDEIFHRYPPRPYDSDTVNKLQSLKKQGCTLSVLSNTAFIKGITMRAFMSRSGLDELFSFQMYSDEVGASKPAPHIFNSMVNMVHGTRLHKGPTNPSIIHIGDNEYADAQGAKTIGISHFIINSNGKTIKDIP